MRILVWGLLVLCALDVVGSVCWLKWGRYPRRPELVTRGWDIFWLGVSAWLVILCAFALWRYPCT